jgi:hypothetical protein
MNDYKENLKMWAKFATYQNDQAWGSYQENLTKEELAEMLTILGSFLRSTSKGRAIIAPWLNTAH